MSILVPVISLWEQVTLGQIIIMFTLYLTNTLSWVFLWYLAYICTVFKEIIMYDVWLEIIFSSNINNAFAYIYININLYFNLKRSPFLYLIIFSCFDQYPVYMKHTIVKMSWYKSTPIRFIWHFTVRWLCYSVVLLNVI
jgi:hypothetical protein